MPSLLRSSRTPEPPSASARRIATVVSSVPDATSARSSTARLAAPPVPMINRDVSLHGPMTSGSSVISASLDRGEHVDARALGHRRGRPVAAADDDAVDRDSDAGPLP